VGLGHGFTSEQSIVRGTSRFRGRTRVSPRPYR
jgi:hypothetical protein